MAGGTQKGDVGRNRCERMQIFKRRERVASLLLQGVPQYRIAEMLQISRPLVVKDLDALEAEWLANARSDRDKWRAREIARIDRLEREAWRGWRHSRGIKEFTRTKASKFPGRPQTLKIAGKDVVETPMLKRDEAEVRRENPDGDPRFLAEIRWCVKMRCDLLGLTREPEAASGNNVQVNVNVNPAVDLTRLSDEQLQQLEQLRGALEDRPKLPPAASEPMPAPNDQKDPAAESSSPEAPPDSGQG